MRRAALFLFTVGTLGTIFGFAFIAELKNGAQDDALLRNWKECVMDNPDRVCNIQSDLSCSGWNELCTDFWIVPTSAPSAPTTAAPVNTTAPADAGYCAVCSNNMNSNTTCYASLKKKVTADFPWFAVAVASAITANVIIAYLVYRTRGETDEQKPLMSRV
jgi:hypothetical protein